MIKHIVNIWESVMDNSRNPLRHLDLASQHYFMQVLGWMWSMIFSLSFFSIMQFGITWLLHLVLFGGVAMTVALFREAERKQLASAPAVDDDKFSSASRCVWRLENEA